jgi:hypothetical protein
MPGVPAAGETLIVGDFTVGEGSITGGSGSRSELPQCAAPFTIGPDGTETVEQGSVDAAAAHIYNIAVCPQGFRDDLPEYGIPPLLWRTLPLDLTALEEALHRWEPAASLELEQHRAAIATAQVTIAVE